MDTLYTRLHHTPPRQVAAITAERLDEMTRPDPSIVSRVTRWACERLHIIPPVRLETLTAEELASTAALLEWVERQPCEVLKA
jgi:hypothetical protein